MSPCPESEAVVSKAEALAWVRPAEPMVEGRIGQVQAEIPFPEVEEAVLHRTVVEPVEVPLGVAPQVFLDPG